MISFCGWLWLVAVGFPVGDSILYCSNLKLCDRERVEVEWRRHGLCGLKVGLGVNQPWAAVKNKFSLWDPAGVLLLWYGITIGTVNIGRESAQYAPASVAIAGASCWQPGIHSLKRHSEPPYRNLRLYELLNLGLSGCRYLANCLPK